VVDENLPADVRSLISGHIDSLVQLEILLLLQRTAPKEWSPKEIERELRIDPVFAGRELQTLSERGLLAARQGPVYYYGPRSPELDAAVAGLATAYAKFRLTVIQSIFAKPSDTIRTFADAFRVRKDE
jgi:hypothetical protein